MTAVTDQGAARPGSISRVWSPAHRSDPGRCGSAARQEAAADGAHPRGARPGHRPQVTSVAGRRRRRCGPRRRGGPGCRPTQGSGRDCRLAGAPRCWPGSSALILERAEELARLESLDVGKPLQFTRMVDVPTAIDTYEYYAQLAAGIEGAARTPCIPAFAYTRREPLGVVGGDHPVQLPADPVGHQARRRAGRRQHRRAQAGRGDAAVGAADRRAVPTRRALPDGVLNVVTGGAAAGAALVGDPRVDKIAFTGSSAVGRAVAERSRRGAQAVTVELGGKGANIIFADADLDAAINTAIAAFVFNTGQFCMAGSRLLVERRSTTPSSGRSAAPSPHVPVGDPFADGAVIGPMAGPRARGEGARATSSPGRQRRATVVVRSASTEGRASSSRRPWSPGSARSRRLVQEEIFGPVLTVQPFDTEEEAVALANGTATGSRPGCRPGTSRRAHRVAAALRAGHRLGQRLGAARPRDAVRRHRPVRLRPGERARGAQEYLRTKSVLDQPGLTVRLTVCLTVYLTVDRTVSLTRSMPMSTTTRAAVVEAPGAPFVVQDVTLDDVRAGEVLVRDGRGRAVPHRSRRPGRRHPVRPARHPRPRGRRHRRARSGPASPGSPPATRCCSASPRAARAPNCRAGHPAYCATWVPDNLITGVRRDGTTTVSRDGDGDRRPLLRPVLVRRSTRSWTSAAWSGSPGDAPLEVPGAARLWRPDRLRRGLEHPRPAAGSHASPSSAPGRSGWPR